MANIVNERKERNTNLELLRIISMILIVMSHSDDWMGLATKYQNTICANKLITDWLHMGGQIGVGCFLLISGYFMVDQQFSVKRILRLLGEVWFYTISIWGLYVVAKAIVGTLSFSSAFKLAINSFFPILFSHYWFVTAYVILMILAPFFNKLINVIDKRTYQLLLAVLITIFFIIGGGLPKVFPGMSEGRLIPVFVMYFVAGYIKKHVNNNINNSKKHLWIAVLGYIFLYATFIGIEMIGSILDSETIMGYCYFWRPLNSPIVLIINVELFLAFLRMKVRQSNKINAIASNTFGVYLIHCNAIIAGSVLPRIFPVYKETNSFKILLYSIGTVIVVYMSCTIIDIIRQKTFEKIWVKILNEKYNVCEDRVKHLIDKIGKRIVLLGKWYYR